MAEREPRYHLADPTDEELAAVIAAVEVAWPRPAPPADAHVAPAWRFSGRWWRGPVASRRERPASWRAGR